MDNLLKKVDALELKIIGIDTKLDQILFSEPVMPKRGRCLAQNVFLSQSKAMMMTILTMKETKMLPKI